MSPNGSHVPAKLVNIAKSCSRMPATNTASRTAMIAVKAIAVERGSRAARARK
jgi:hypothetical protein